MLDSGDSMLDSVDSILDSGDFNLDSGDFMLDSSDSTLDSGDSMLDSVQYLNVKNSKSFGASYCVVMEENTKTLSDFEKLSYRHVLIKIP